MHSQRYSFIIKEFNVIVPLQTKSLF